MLHSSSIGAGSGLVDTSNLGIGADNALTRSVVDGVDITLLGLRALPNLDLAATVEDTVAHGREEVVGGVGVVVDTTVEDSGGVLANGRADESLATGVLLDEVGNVVDDTSNGNEGLAVSLGGLNKVVPADDGELLNGGSPVEGGALLVNLLLELLDAALFNLVGAELLEVVGEANPAPGDNGPLGRVVLVPVDGVAEVRGELVVEVVVSLTEGDESSDEVVAGRVAVIEGLVTEPVGKRVDAESSLLDEADAEDTGVDETTNPVVPAKTADEGGEDEGHGENNLDVVAVLEDNDGVLVKIGNVGAALVLGVLLEDHPAEVRVPEALADRVRVLDGIGIAVVDAVLLGPPADRALDGAGANKSEVELQRPGSLVSRVSPETVVAGRDAETSVEVVDDGEDGRVEVKRDKVGSDEAGDGQEHNKSGVEPVDLLVPVRPGHGQLRDVHLGRVVLGSGTHGLVVGSAVPETGGIASRCGRGLGDVGRGSRGGHC